MAQRRGPGSCLPQLECQPYGRFSLPTSRIVISKINHHADCIHKGEEVSVGEKESTHSEANSIHPADGMDCGVSEDAAPQIPITD